MIKRNCILNGFMSAFGYIGTWFGFSIIGIFSGFLAAIIQSWIGNKIVNSTFATYISYGIIAVFSFTTVFGLAIFSFGLFDFLFKKKEKTFIEKLLSFYNDIKEKILSFFNEDKEQSQPHKEITIFNYAKEKAEININNAKEKSLPFFNDAKEKAQPFINKAKEKAQPFINKAKEKAQPFINYVKEKSETYIEKAKEKSLPFLNKVKEKSDIYINKAKEKSSDFFSELFDEIF